MQTDLIVIIGAAVAALAIGIFISYMLLKRNVKAKEALAEEKARTILKDAESEAEVIKKNKILEAKEKFLQLKSEHEKVIGEKERNIGVAENRIKQKEASVSQKLEQTQRKQHEYEQLQANLKNQLSILEGKKEEMSKMHQRQVELLE